MHKMIPAALALVLAPTLTVTAFGIRAEETPVGAAPHWTYAGATGPEHWGELDTAFSTCASGVNQSPIDIRSTLDADLPPLRIRYEGRGTEILNNGHTIQVNVAPGSILTLEGTPFELKQFHFHAPSENTVDGESFAMEAQLVHADAEGHLAVMGVLYRLGKENQAMAEMLAYMPHEAGMKQALLSSIDPAGFLPRVGDYYRFNGSLTTPPCTEGVRWVVIKEPLAVSKGQVQAFQAAMHGANNRPVQEVNARPVLR
ncbi:MAG: carbonic anhydrase [Anaerolineae bacterium]|jgi:carbonic anhydrase